MSLRTTRSKIPAPGALCVVKWRDIVSNPEWEPAESEATPLPICFTVGWVKKKTRTLIHMTATLQYDEEMVLAETGDSVTIPIGAVEDIISIDRFSEMMEVHDK